MLFKQYYLGCLAHASYLIGDREAGTAAIVDPQRDVDGYLEDAAQMGVRIEYVILTHFHADFVAGHLELHERTGATICLGARGRAEYEFQAMRDGDELHLGSVRLEILETPGHSPESISIVVYDPAASPTRSHAVLTGDALFVGDVGRPDLRVSQGWSAAELGGMLYDSLHQRLLKLPDETILYPAHGAGSMCGKNISSDIFSTIGAQRLANYALQPMSRERFIEIVTADQPDAPGYFAHAASLNATVHPTFEETLEMELKLKPLSLDDVLHAAAGGTQILDTRDPAAFAAAHLRGSVNVGLGGRFATFAGSVLDPQDTIAIVAESGCEKEARTRLARIGFDRVRGYLDGGMRAAARDVVETVSRITARELQEDLDGPQPPIVLDVRSVHEWRMGHIPHSINIPLPRLNERMAEIPHRRTVVSCRSGYRSSIAWSVLKQRGYDVIDLVGGMNAWETAELPMPA